MAPEEEIPYKSKTEKKKEAAALQKLGEELAGLPAPQLKQLDLPQDLYQALVDAKSITSNVAARRHRQFIGALMRDVDPDPIRMALARAKAEPARGFDTDNEADRVINDWLEKLMAQDHEALEAFISICPHADRQQIRQLARNASKDKAKNKKSSKSLNTLKQIISQCLEEQ